MSDTKHTAGDWQVGVCGNANIVCYDGDDIRPIATVFNLAHCDLVASAPSLCKQVTQLTAQRDKLLAALKKAEGLIAHSPGCNERYYGRDQTCNCGFYETKTQIRITISQCENAQVANAERTEG